MNYLQLVTFIGASDNEADKMLKNLATVEGPLASSYQEKVDKQAVPFVDSIKGGKRAFGEALYNAFGDVFAQQVIDLGKVRS